MVVNASRLAIYYERVATIKVLIIITPEELI